MSEFDLSDEELRLLYSWVDSIPLSRPKRNFTRDFSDGVMTAEIVKYLLPKYIELHNYPPANSVQQKLINWHTLNHKVFRKFGFILPEDLIQGIVNCQTGVVEFVLLQLRNTIEAQFGSSLPNYDHHNQQQQQQSDMYHQNAASSGIPIYRNGGGPRHPSHSDKRKFLIPTTASKKVAPEVEYHKPMPNEKPHKKTISSNEPPKKAPEKIPNGFISASPKKNKQPTMEDGNDDQLDQEQQNDDEEHDLGQAKPTIPQVSNAEKDEMIMELQETVQILQLKVQKLEQLILLKDRVINELQESAN